MTKGEQTNGTASPPGADLLTLLLERRGELRSVLRRHGVVWRDAPGLVTEAVLATCSDGESCPTGRRLLRTLDVVCSRWAAERQNPPDAGDGHDDHLAELLHRVARRLAVRRSRLADEREAAPELVAELLGLPAQHQLEALAAHRFQTRAVADRLLEGARDQFTDNARRALALATLAGEVAQRLDPRRYGTSALCDLRARAGMAAGNAHRILGDLQTAEETLAHAGRLLEEGSLAPGLRAELLRLKATLRRYQRRFEDAERLLDQAAAIHRWTGDRHQEGKLLLSKAALRERQGEPEQVVPLLESALDLLDPQREPRLQLVAWQNLVTQLHQRGEPAAAAELLPRTRRLAAELGVGRLDHLRLDWTEGAVRLALGDEDGAGLLQATRQAFIDESMPIEAALVSLELAVYHLEAGRCAETRRLVDELVPLLRARRVHREAMAALLVLQQAARRQQATSAMAREVAATLRRVQEKGTSRAPS